MIYVLVALLTFLIMEPVTWLTHRYVMHGFLWYLHKDHHQKEEGFFEKNDYYAVVFSIVASSSIIYGNTHADFWFLDT